MERRASGRCASASLLAIADVFGVTRRLSPSTDTRGVTAPRSSTRRADTTAAGSLGTGGKREARTQARTRSSDMREGVTDRQYAFYQCIGDTNPAGVNTKAVTARLFIAARLYFMGVFNSKFHIPFVALSDRLLP